MFYRLNKHAKSIKCCERACNSWNWSHLYFRSQLLEYKALWREKWSVGWKHRHHAYYVLYYWQVHQKCSHKYLKHCKEGWSRCPHSLQLWLWVSFPYWYVCLDNLEPNFLPFFAMYHFFASCDNSLNFPPSLFWNDLIEIVIKLWPAHF